jgi:hypothetical protein
VAYYCCFGLFMDCTCGVFFRNLHKKYTRSNREITADFSEEGIHLTPSSTDTQLRWDSFMRYLESEQTLIFFYSKRKFIFVPKRVFAPGEIEALHILLLDKTPARLPFCHHPAAS